jgi:hypothetical protein
MVRALYAFWTGNLMGPGGDQDMVRKKRFLPLPGIECPVHGLALGLRVNSEILNIFVAGIPPLRARASYLGKHPCTKCS